MADCEAELTADERRRNGHGAPALFVGEGHPLFKPMAACYGDEPCEVLALTPELFPGAAAALSIAGTLTPLGGAPPPHELLRVPEFKVSARVRVRVRVSARVRVKVSLDLTLTRTLTHPLP